MSSSHTRTSGTEEESNGKGEIPSVEVEVNGWYLRIEVSSATLVNATPAGAAPCGPRKLEAMSEFADITDEMCVLVVMWLCGG